jgi:hypothetical protein
VEGPSLTEAGVVPPHLKTVWEDTTRTALPRLCASQCCTARAGKPVARKLGRRTIVTDSELASLPRGAAEATGPGRGGLSDMGGPMGRQARGR